MALLLTSARTSFDRSRTTLVRNNRDQSLQRRRSTQVALAVAMGMSRQWQIRSYRRTFEISMLGHPGDGFHDHLATESIYRTED
jgi:hypothetical protein